MGQKGSEVPQGSVWELLLISLTVCRVNGWEHRPWDGGGQWDSMMWDFMSTGPGHRMGTVFDILITFNILLSCLWQMVSGRHAQTFFPWEGHISFIVVSHKPKAKQILYHSCIVRMQNVLRDLIPNSIRSCTWVTSCTMWHFALTR